MKSSQFVYLHVLASFRMKKRPFAACWQHTVAEHVLSNFVWRQAEVKAVFAWCRTTSLR